MDGVDTPSARTYNARSRADMRDLAKALALIPKAARPGVAANLIADGLMIPRQWWLRAIMWLVKKRHGYDTFEAWAHVCLKAPEIADELLEQTIDWIVSGKDADGEGVGGFNQREADALARMLLTVDRVVPAYPQGRAA